MNTEDLKRASAALDELNRAERNLDALLTSDMKVTGIILSRDSSTETPSAITLRKGVSGTGTINSIGYSDELRDAMTRALQDHFKRVVEVARGSLRAYGIKVEK